MDNLESNDDFDESYYLRRRNLSVRLNSLLETDLESISSRINDVEALYLMNESTNESHYQIVGKYLMLSGKKIGVHSGLSDLYKHIIPMRMSISESLKIARDVYSQCTSPVSASNAPSMMLHQLSALVFGISVKGYVQWEEPHGSYTPDLTITVKGERILVDITSKNVESKMSSIPNFPKIVIDKYSLLSDFEPEVRLLKKWSTANDTFDTDLIMKMVTSQSLGKELLYSRDTLDFFSQNESKTTLSLKDHYSIAIEQMYRVYEDEAKDVSFEFDNKELNNEIYKMTSVFVDEFKSIPDKCQSDYFIFPLIDITFTNLGRNNIIQTDEPTSFIRDGFLDYGYIDKKEYVNFFEKADKMIVTTRAYIELMGYPADKENKRIFIKDYYDKLAKKWGSYTAAWKQILRERLIEKMGFDIINPFYQKNNKLSKNFCGIDRLKTEFNPKISLNLINIQPMSIDPDHEKLLTQRGCSDLIPTLELVRDYHELRFRSRVSQGIAYNKIPERCFTVKHWKFDNLFALVKIKGLVLEKDKGVAYVSFFNDEQLIRTEKWRLSDVENYSVGHLRLITALASMRKSLDRKLTAVEITMFARIISENSWGLSKFLKVYRYFSSGICMSSTQVEDTIKKLKKSVDAPVKSKLSFIMLMGILNQKSRESSICYGKTPAFSLEFKDLGWESFLVNLCPSSTYGKMRHLENTVSELADEIDMFNDNFNHIAELYREFDDLVKIKNRSKLPQAYYSHFQNVIKLSKITDGRFTFTPASLVALYPEIEKTKTSYKVFQGSVPPISDLMTAKASTDTFNSKPCLAIESILSLCQRYGTSSTSLLAIKILDKLSNGGLIDLTMRMFDKDQIGGDREISILSSEFRILQVIVERFFEKWAGITGIDKLHDKNKVRDLVQSYESSIQGILPSCLTADQTRWGPNFNTLIFGLMACMLNGRTTECYLPALICFLAEFKIFEMPSHLPNLLDRSDSFYTILGKLGRNHMGQGIFHQSSSMYHTLVIMSLKTYLLNNFNPDEYKDSIKQLNYNVDPFVTSDDVAIITYFSGNVGNVTDEDRKEIEHVKMMTNKIFSNIFNFFILFGIKTSTYKNIISEKVEFNSIHLGDKRMASTELKFCYSLLDPSTTGNFLNDFFNVYDIYVSARNSFCSHDTAVIISNSCLLKFCRQWKLDFSLLSFQREEDLLAGLPKPYTVYLDPDTSTSYLHTDSTLRYKTRKLMQSRVNTGNPVLDEMTHCSLLRMQSTRQKTSYRSILTYSKEDTLLIMSDYFSFNKSIGESYLLFVKEVLKDPDHISMIVNRKYQTTFSCYAEENESKECYFKFLKLRDPVSVTINLQDLVVSHYPYQTYLSGDCNSVQLHMMRKRKTINLTEHMFDYRVTSYVQALSICEEKVRELEMQSTSCTTVVSNGKQESIKYIRYTYYPPSSLKFMKRSFLFKYCTDVRLLIPSRRYYRSRLVDILRVSIDPNYKIQTYRESSGWQVPNIPISEVEFNEIDYNNLMYYDFRWMRNNELEYRSKSQEPVYLNVQLDSKKLPERTPSIISEVKSTPLSQAQRYNMLLDFGSLDSGFEELLIEDNIDESKVELQPITEDDELAELLNPDSHQTTELSTYSVEISPEFGFLCNQSWSTDVIIRDAILKMMDELMITYRQKGSIEINEFKESVVYTFDSDFKKKFDVLTANSKIACRQNDMLKDKETLKEALLRLIKNETKNKDLLLLLLNGFSSISISSSALGAIISTERMSNYIVDY